MVRLELTTVYFGHAGAMVVSTLPTEIDHTIHIAFRTYAAQMPKKVLLHHKEAHSLVGSSSKGKKRSTMDPESSKPERSSKNKRKRRKVRSIRS